MEQCCSSQHDYESIDFARNHRRRRLKKNLILCALYTVIVAAVITLLVWQAQGTQSFKHPISLHKVIHITDPHIDIFFDPDESVPKGGCHTCDFVFSSNSTSEAVSCPSEEDIHLHIAKTRAAATSELMSSSALVSNSNISSSDQHSKLSSFSSSSSYLFGRYGCDPPLRLWTSLLAAMKQVDTSPPVVVLTGDM
jgi:hypothetical protein